MNPSSYPHPRGAAKPRAHYTYSVYADSETAEHFDESRFGGPIGGMLHVPVWPFWVAGAACEAVCVPLGLEPPLYRRRVDFFTKSRAFDITRARREIGYAPKTGLREGISRTLTWYGERRWL